MYIWVREGAKRLINRDFDYSLTPRQKVAYRTAAYGIPFAGAALEAHDRMGYYDDYFKNRGMTWSDVKYPFMLNTGAGKTLSQGVNFVSHNLTKLYSNEYEKQRERVSRAYDRGFRASNSYWRGYNNSMSWVKY